MPKEKKGILHKQVNLGMVIVIVLMLTISLLSLISYIDELQTKLTNANKTISILFDPTYAFYEVSDNEMKTTKEKIKIKEANGVIN